MTPEISLALLLRSLSSHEGFSGMPLQLVTLLHLLRKCSSCSCCHLTLQAFEVIRHSASILTWTSRTLSANNVSGSFSSDHPGSSGKRCARNYGIRKENHTQPMLQKKKKKAQLNEKGWRVSSSTSTLNLVFLLSLSLLCRLSSEEKRKRFHSKRCVIVFEWLTWILKLPHYFSNTRYFF